MRLASTIPTTRTERRSRHPSLTEVYRRHSRSPAEQGLERGGATFGTATGKRGFSVSDGSPKCAEKEKVERAFPAWDEASPAFSDDAPDRRRSRKPAKGGRNKAPPRSVRSGRASRRGRQWWRRWESNPRPKRSHRGVYVRILRLGLAQEAARRRATSCASGHVGVDSVPATRTWSSLQDDASPLSRRRRFSVGA